jgi:Helix-turn-helix domain
MANKFTDATDGAREIGSRERLVLMYLAHRSDNDTGICWPSEKRIAKDYDLSERTVVRAIAELKKSRLIKIVGQRTYPGKKPVSVYQINLNKLLKLAPVEEKAKLEYTLEHDFLPVIKSLDPEESRTDPKPGITDPKPGITDPKPGITDPKPGITDPEVRLDDAQTQSLNSTGNSTGDSSLGHCTAKGEPVERSASPMEIGQKQESQKQPQEITQQECQDIAEAWWALENHSPKSTTDDTDDDFDMYALDALFKIASVTEVLNVLAWLPNSNSWDKPNVVEGGTAKGVLKDFSEFCSLFPKIHKSYLRYLQKTPEKYHHKYIWKRQQA